ncbi:MAG TPA: diacylglycerol kinase family protein [Methylomirabilota bacterium]|nr:diacylglycerol kinase family protein [Methylomirabilota bacterium]
MRTCVIFNPAARGDKARHFQRHLNEIASEAALKPTKRAGEARRLSAEAVSEHFEVVVAAGGDGTVNEVLNGIADAGGFERTRLGVLPLGTVNVFAKELRLPQNVTSAWNVIQRGKDMRIDAPWASQIVEGKTQRRYFAQMAGAGLDSRAVELVSWQLKKRFGPLAYFVAGLQALGEKLPLIEISNGHESASGQLVLIGNGKFYGGRFTVFPLADLCDGVLEAVIFPRINLETLARSGWGMMTDNFHTGRKTIQIKGSQLELKCAASIPLQLDGENVGPLPAMVGVLPRALRVIVP